MLKAYMASGQDSTEGAILVFHKTAKDAKRLGYGYIVYEWMGYDYIDVKCRQIKNNLICAFGDQSKLEKNIPHVIEEPPYCKGCGYWGHGCNKVGICDWCGEDTGFDQEFIGLILKYKDS